MKNFNFGTLRKACVLRQVRNGNVYFTWERCGLFPFSLLLFLMLILAVIYIRVNEVFWKRSKKDRT